MIDKEIISKFTSATIIVVFYIICYFAPRLYTYILQNPAFESILEDVFKSNNLQEGFQKMHALLFLFVIMLLLAFVIAIYVLLIIYALFFTDGSFKEKLCFATSWLASFIWDNGKKLNIWLAILIAITVGYAIVNLYDVMRPKTSKNDPVFPLISLNNKNEDDEDAEGGEDSEITIDLSEFIGLSYKYWLHVVVSIAIFTLALLSLYGKSNVNYVCAAMYILSLGAIFIGLQWPLAIAVVVLLLAVPAFLDGT
jgi:hypothetical protein